MNAEAETNRHHNLMRLQQLPLFALETWLYPGVPLQLQVFETRYLDMVSEQLKKNEGFGVVPIRRGREVGQVPQIYALGLLVNITDWRQQTNSLLGITVQGEKRFRVLQSQVQDSGLLVGDVETLPNIEGAPIEEEFQGLMALLEQLKKHETIKSMALPPVRDTAGLSWQLAQVLPLNATEKMALMALNEPDERLDCLARKVSSLSEK